MTDTAISSIATTGPFSLQAFHAMAGVALGGAYAAKTGSTRAVIGRDRALKASHAIEDGGLRRFLQDTAPTLTAVGTTLLVLVAFTHRRDLKRARASPSKRWRRHNKRGHSRRRGWWR